MGRQKKFDERSKVLTIRVPESQHDKIKTIVMDVLNGQLPGRNSNLEMDVLKKGYDQFNSLFENVMKNASKMLKTSQIEMFRQLIKDNIDIELIKKINSEMS